ncbi:MAG: glycosyltransferase 87 family protein [Terriglobia bacterium]
MSKHLPSWIPIVAILALGTLMIAIFSAWRYWDRDNLLVTYMPEFIASVLLAGVLYLVAVYIVENLHPGPVALGAILGGAVVFRVMLLPLSPSISQDVYRYQWEGRVERQWINPYTVYPADPKLGRLQDASHPITTGRFTPTAYPPLSEVLFASVRSIHGYKRLFTAFDLASIAVILLILGRLGQPLCRVLIYAWNPAVIVAFALSGHHDSLAVFALLLANYLIIKQKPLLSNIFLGLSFLSKFFAAILVPVFLKRTRWAYAWLLGGVAVIAYLPFARAGWGLFGGVSDYARGWEGNDSLFRLLHFVIPTKNLAEAVAGLLLLALAGYATRRNMPPLRASLLLISAMLLFSPNAFPWYFTWSIPFLCFETYAPWLLMSVSCALGYSPVVAYAAGQPYRDSPAILLLEYAPVILWIAWDLARRWRNGLLSARPTSTAPILDG